jgi:Phage derived protein Gp49-like (DUF891)
VTGWKREEGLTSPVAAIRDLTFSHSRSCLRRGSSTPRPGSTERLSRAPSDPATFLSFHLKNGIWSHGSHYDGNTYRAVYTVRFKAVVYALHAFQKKSPRGIKTAQVDVDLVKRRLRIAQQDYEVRYGKAKR